MKKLTLFALIVASSSFAKMGNFNVLPTAQFFPNPTGILFPNIATAGGVNAAALPLAGKATVIQAAYTRHSRTGPDSFFAGTGLTSKKFGISLGYLGDRIGESLVHNSYAGAGFAIDQVSLGINVRRFDWSGTASTGVDIGVLVGQGKGFTWGFVVHNVNGTARLNGGIGFGGGKKYNMEINVLMPPFNGGGNVYAITAAGTINPAQWFGVHFKTTYYSDEQYQHVLGASIFVTDAVGLVAQFSSPTTWTGGLTLAF